MVLTGLVLLVTAYCVYELVTYYRAAAGTWWQRALTSVKKTAASLWTGFTVLSALLMGWLEQVANFVNAPNVATALQTYGKPQVVAAIFIGSAIVIEFAKRMHQKD